MNKLGRIILLVFVGMVAAERSPAVAATTAGDFEISPFVGYHWFDNETDYGDDLVWGGRLGYLYNANNEAEFALAVASWTWIRSASAPEPRRSVGTIVRHPGRCEGKCPGLPTR